MAEYIKPGIYINEYDKSSYITEGPTTITGVVGTSAKGPSNEIVLTTNYSEYVSLFGQDSGYLDFFARFFFKYGGNKLLVVRATDNFNFAGITNGLGSTYQVKSTLATSDESIDIELVAGNLDYTNWPESGLVRLDYYGDTEYFTYREIDYVSAGDITLLDCHRGLNGTTALSIGVWGTAVTGSATTDTFTTASPHGLQNGQKVRFLSTNCGVVITTDYWVINRTSTTFQITAVNGGTAIFDLSVTVPMTNTLQKQPVPTKYVQVIAPIVCGEVLSGETTTTVTFEGMKFGQFVVGEKIMFNDASNPSAPYYDEIEVESISVAFNELTRTQTVVLTTPAPAAANGTWACMVIDPYYGGMGAWSLPMYTNYDAWALPKYDENGYLVKGAGITDPTEMPIFMNIYARSCGAWANTDVRVTVYTHDAWDSSTVVPYFKNKVDYSPTADDELLIVVESVATGQIEEQWLVSLIPTKVDYWGKSMFITDLINDYSQWIRVFVNPSYIAATGSAYNTPTSISYLPHSFERYYLSGGTDGAATITQNGVYNTPQVREYKINAGYDLFANKNEVDVDLISAGGNQSLTIQANIKSIAETRKDCVGILNIPWGLEISDAVRYKNLLGSSTYSAIYCNGSKVLDSFTGSLVSLPPAIQVTPLIVKTDLLRDPWFAAAGYNRGMLSEVVELEQVITDGDFETLYAAGINPIVNDGAGPVVFGIKTMYVGSSAFTKITVRRLMLKMEKDIKNSMKAFLFEPNTFDTRLRIVRTVEPYLESIKSRDGIDDYRVICDGTNNTDQTIAAGQIIVDIYIKPVFAAEYIIFNFTVTKDEISSIINNT